MSAVQCQKCGSILLIAVGERKQCHCGTWNAGEDVETIVDAAGPAHDTWSPVEADVAAIERLNDGYRRMRKELGKVIVGQERVIEELLIAIFARGHCLLVGVPGLAKTLMIRTLADSLSA